MRFSCECVALNGFSLVLRWLSSGLGTGIAASAFIKHDISTTVVEIDPAVYDAATQYFGFVADQQQVAIEDARTWVTEKGEELATASDKTENKLFDYVIHDCFSGGSVPGHMFTQLFWEDLSKIVKPEGVIAVVSGISVHLPFS